MCHWSFVAQAFLVFNKNLFHLHASHVESIKGNRLVENLENRSTNLGTWGFIYMECHKNVWGDGQSIKYPRKVISYPLLGSISCTSRDAGQVKIYPWMVSIFFGWGDSFTFWLWYISNVIKVTILARIIVGMFFQTSWSSIQIYVCVMVWSLENPAFQWPQDSSRKFHTRWCLEGGFVRPGGI